MYVVVDTFKFSTTVVTALENEDIHRVMSARTLEELSELDVPIGGDHTPKSPIGNNPLEFHQADFETDVVGLTSDNGAAAVHHILDNGGFEVVLGCPRNLSAVSNYITEQEKDFIIVPANSHGEPVIEDYVASVAISEISNRNDYSRSELAVIERKMSKSLDKDHFDSKVSDFCKNVDESDIVPYTTDGEFRSRRELQDP